MADILTKLYRNVSRVFLYQLHEIYAIHIIWLVALATEWLKVEAYIKKIIFSKTKKPQKLQQKPSKC